MTIRSWYLDPLDVPYSTFVAAAYSEASAVVMSAETVKRATDKRVHGIQICLRWGSDIRSESVQSCH